MDCQQLAAQTGQYLLFMGANTINWNVSQFQQAAAATRALGFDTLLIKVADGGNVWYGGMGGWQAIKNAVHAEGVGAIPWMYCYGNKFGALQTELDLLASYMQDAGIVCADMEIEYNGQVGWAHTMCQFMQPRPGVFLVSTWADPSLQNWLGVIEALAPCVDAFMPQQYNSYLGTFWQEFGTHGASCLQPTFDLSQEAGANNQVALAQAAYAQGHYAMSLWYYDLAIANPTLTKGILQAFPRRNLQGGSEDMYVEISIDAVASAFTAISDTQWQLKGTDIVLANDHLRYYRYNGHVPTHGFPRTNEISLFPGDPVKGHVTAVVYERRVNVYDPPDANGKRIFDNPWIDPAQPVQSVYPGHVDQNTLLKLLLQAANLLQTEVPQSNIDQVASGLQAVASAIPNMLHLLQKE